MRIIALDPGVTTGYAIGEIQEGKMFVVTGQERWRHVGLWTFLTEQKPDVLISERFEFRNSARSGLELYSRELIGVTYLYAQIAMGVDEIVLQNPMKNSSTTHFNDKRLKVVGIHKPGKDHSNDAARHLLHWFQFGSGFQYNQHGYEAIA